MSQSRFSIVLVGVSALLRRPLVSRLRPAGFTARGSGGFRRSGRPSVSAFAARRVGLRAHDFRFSACAASEIDARRVGLRTHGFRFLVCAASGLPSAGWFFCLPLPLFGTHRFGVAAGRVGSSARRVGLRAHDFRFSACAASELPLGELVLLPSVSEIAARQVGASARRVGLRAHDFRFSACAASELPSASWRFRSAGWASGSRLPLFGMRRSAPPYRRSEGRRSAPTRHLFYFKTLISTC